MEKIKTKAEDGFFYVWSPFSRDFVSRAKKLGGKWDGDISAWRFQDAFTDAVRELLRDVYCYDDLSTPETVTVKVAFGEICGVCCGSVVMFNKTLARAYGRDSGASVGEDVALVSGSIYSGGSRANWRSCVGEGAVFILTNVVKQMFLERKSYWEDEYGCAFELICDNCVDKAALQEERARLVARIEEIDSLLNQG